MLYQIRKCCILMTKPFLSWCSKKKKKSCNLVSNHKDFVNKKCNTYKDCVQMQHLSVVLSGEELVAFICTCSGESEYLCLDSS